MTFLILANFKSHKISSEAKKWLEIVSAHPFSSEVEVSVAPSPIHLELFSDKLAHRQPDVQTRRSTDSPDISLAAQDVSPFPVGSYTGAVNASQLVDLGIKYCLVGHSERRRYFHETPSDVAAKVRQLLDVGITPIICLSTEDITPQFAALDDSLRARCLFCYEPPGDIGGTESAAPEDIKKVTDRIHSYAPTHPVMYGGSVNEQNVAALRLLGLGGVLVATACLDPKQFIATIEAYIHGKG